MQSVLITGANRGLGLELSKRLAKSGFEVIMTGRDVQAITDACNNVKELTTSSHVYPLLLDVANEEHIQSLPERIRQLPRSAKGLDLLVNNAAIKEDGWNVPVLTRLIETNVKSPVRLALLLAADKSALLNEGGRIMNVSWSGAQLKNFVSPYNQLMDLGSNTFADLDQLLAFDWFHPNRM